MSDEPNVIELEPQPSPGALEMAEIEAEVSERAEHRAAVNEAVAGFVEAQERAAEEDRDARESRKRPKRAKPDEDA